MRATFHPEIEAILERQLTREEFLAGLAATTEEERQEQEALIRWFLSRYPTPTERLRYAARKRDELARRGAVPVG